MTVPPTVMTLGRIRWRRSMKNRTMSMQPNSRREMSSHPGPYCHAAHANMTPVKSSTSG